MLLRSSFRKLRHPDTDASLKLISSHPTIGSVGLSEADAKEKYGEDTIKIYTTSVSRTQLVRAMMHS